MRGLHLTEREAKRAQILNLVLEGRCEASKAAELMGVSERHVWRMLSRYRQEGLSALVHGNRGKSPAHATPREIRERVVQLATGPYDGANDTHMVELMAQRDGLLLSRQTVQRILRKAGVKSSRRRRAPKHRSRRERYPQEGMLLQIDGSRHRWLGKDRPALTLVAAIDDATGDVPYALFREHEDAQGYFILLRETIRRRGIPLAIYSDRHSIFTVSQPETIDQQLEGRTPQTQFGMALDALDINLILANSPQAKGRIERLWGTFQGRLVKELELANARTIGDASVVLEEFVARHNKRSVVEANQPGKAYRTAAGIDLDSVLCFRYQRTVAADNTVSFGGEDLQIEPDSERSTYARATVEVQERLDGRIVVMHKGRELASTVAPLRPAVLRARRRKAQAGKRGDGRAGDGSVSSTPLSSPKDRKPAPDHPWRSRLIQPKPVVLTKSLSSKTDKVTEH